MRQRRPPQMLQPPLYQLRSLPSLLPVLCEFGETLDDHDMLDKLGKHLGHKNPTKKFGNCEALLRYHGTKGTTVLALAQAIVKANAGAIVKNYFSDEVCRAVF
eukprot:m.53157 g.53157  ORF g.53157 m.53157 type:complete len:103 (+) comp6739_c0_seq2:282-590(+)